MHATTETPAAYDWPADVLAMADKAGLRGVLEPLRLATLAQFPTARQVDITAEPDPEIPNLDFIVFNVHIPIDDVPDYLGACHAWGGTMLELRGDLPSNPSIVLSLRVEKP